MDKGSDNSSDIGDIAPEGAELEDFFHSRDLARAQPQGNANYASVCSEPHDEDNIELCVQNLHLRDIGLGGDPNAAPAPGRNHHQLLLEWVDAVRQGFEAVNTFRELQSVPVGDIGSVSLFAFEEG